MATFTSAGAGKYIKQLEDEKENLLRIEHERCTYDLVVGEEELRPAYDFDATQTQVDALDGKIRHVRHALHLFNAHTELPCGMTIDEALIALAQLSRKKARLDDLRSRQERERLGTRMFAKTDAVEYRYANYDVSAAEEMYRAVSQQVSELQLEIDLCNQTKTFEVEV